MTDILKSPFVGGKTTEAEYKPRIYVCSPYRPRSQDPFAVKKELECNIDRAKTACRMVADLGGVPICSHLFCTQFLDDNIPAELWCFSEYISEGMAAEIQEASKLSIPVRMFCETAGLLKKVLGAFIEELELRKQRE